MGFSAWNQLARVSSRECVISWPVTGRAAAASTVATAAVLPSSVVNSTSNAFPIRVHVNHGSHVAHFEALSRYGLRQHDAIVFLDHLERSLLARIRGDEPRRILPAVDDPNVP